MSSTVDKDLAAELHKWAVKEMHFYAQGSVTGQHIPSEEDFRLTVKTVIGNLSLNKKTSTPAYKVKYGNKNQPYEQTKQELLEKRSALSNELTATLRDISHLENEAERLTGEIVETDRTYQRETDNINNLRRKASLLNAFSHKCKDTVSQYREYSRSIDTRVNDIGRRAQKSFESEDYYSRDSGAVIEDDEEDGEMPTSALETISAKNVRECCEHIGDFLHDTLKGTFGGDKTEFTRRKEPLWQKVEEVARNFSADQILNSLLTYTRNTTVALKSMTKNVNIRRDAQNLRFKYEPSGEVQDLAEPPSLLKSVHQLLQAKYTEHFQRFMCSQKYLNEAKSLELSITATKGHVENRLKKLFAQKVADMQIARNLIDAELELDGCRGALHCLSSEAEKFKEVVEKSYRERQELFAKYHKIQEFQDLTDRKQNVIKVLVKQNINSQSRLDAQIVEINQYIERSLKSHQDKINTVCGKLQHCVTTEVNEFANLALPYIMFSQIDNALKTAVLDLSIHQTLPSHIRPALITVLECLKFPSFQAPEMILKQCLTIKDNMEEVVHRIEREKYLKKNKDGQKDIITVINGLCETMSDQDQNQLSKTLPMLQQKVNKTMSALSACQRSKEAAREWWDQPGQSCVPWITVDGHPLQYYLDQWKVLTADLRQRLVK